MAKLKVGPASSANEEKFSNGGAGNEEKFAQGIANAMPEVEDAYDRGYMAAPRHVGATKTKRNKPNRRLEEDPSETKDYFRTIGAELLGTTLLTFMITSTVVFSGLDSDSFQGSLSVMPIMTTSRHLLISISAGMSYSVLLYCTMWISGGHLNPAVTIAYAATNNFEGGWGKAVLYVLAQCLGSIFGAGVTRLCLPVPPPPPPHSLLRHILLIFWHAIDAFGPFSEFLTFTPTLAVL
jgi:hypothetical protein